MDPTTDNLYLKRKSIPMVDTITDEAHQPALPREGWSKDLKYLPTFNDININTYTHKSGKKAFNESGGKKGLVSVLLREVTSFMLKIMSMIYGVPKMITYILLKLNVLRVKRRMTNPTKCGRVFLLTLHMMLYMVTVRAWQGHQVILIM